MSDYCHSLPPIVKKTFGSDGLFDIIARLQQIVDK